MARILITAGEVSGDLLGAEIMQAIQAVRPDTTFHGIGGDKMHAAGLQPLASMDIFPGMGLVEVLASIPDVSRTIKALHAWAQSEKPDLVLTLDNQEFSARLAKKLAPLGIPCILYPAPKVWAWRQHRVVGLQKIFKHVLCLFPFEPDFFTAHNLPATYIGHPVALRLAGLTPEASPAPQTRQPLTLALLPGSRRAELAHHWPLFLNTYRRMRATHPGLTAVLPLPDAAALTRVQALGWEEGVDVAIGDTRFGALKTCTAALTKSGTNNLELALMGIPAVVAYRMNALTYTLVKRLVKVPAISPVNLVANGLEGVNHVYPEYVQDDATEGTLAAALTPLLLGGAPRGTQISRLGAVRRQLATSQPPAQKAAEVVLSYLPTR